MAEAKSELDYGKAEMADEPQATKTVNPEHFAAASNPFDVFIGSRWVNRVYDQEADPEEVKRSLINHDGYSPSIEVRRGGARARPASRGPRSRSGWARRTSTTSWRPG